MSKASNLVTSARTGRTAVVRSVVTGAQGQVIGYRTTKGYLPVTEARFS